MLLEPISVLIRNMADSRSFSCCGFPFDCLDEQQLDPRVFASFQEFDQEP